RSSAPATRPRSAPCRRGSGWGPCGSSNRAWRPASASSSRASRASNRGRACSRRKSRPRKRQAPPEIIPPPPALPGRGDAKGRFFIDPPIVAIVIFILTVLLGLVAMTGLPIAQYPDIVPPLIQIQGTYPGADAVTVEQSVATPLEQQMNGVEDELYMQSVNASDGTITLRVTFDVGTDRNADQVNAQNRVSQALPNLPPDVNTFGLTYRKTSGTPLVLISLYSPKGTYPGIFLGNYALINLNDALYRVPGVGQVNNFGASEYAMRVWVRPDQLAKLSLTVGDLLRALQQQNTVNPSGQVGAEP